MSAPGFFTHNSSSYELPHPPIGGRLILVAHLAFIRAFEMLRTAPPPGFILSSAKEDDITRQLDDILANDILPNESVAGFNRNFFRHVGRASELTNVDGKHPAKKPDIVLSLSSENRPRVISNQDALFVECKPVEKTKSLGSHYCNEGISRFVIGDYAWAMREAMMLAYVRHNYTTKKHLRDVLGKNGSKNLGRPTSPKIVAGGQATKFSQPLCYTHHERSFVWPSNAKRASRLKLFHSWHDCN